MQKTIRKILDRPTLVKLLVIAVWVAAMGFLVVTGKYSLYLHPRYIVLPIFSIGILIAMAISLIANAKVPVPYDDDGTPAAEYNGEHHAISAPFQRVLLFLLPPFLLVAIGVQSLRGASSTASSVSIKGSQSASQDVLPDASEVVDDGQYFEIDADGIYEGSALDRLHKSVKLIGMVYTGKGVPEGMYALVRLRMVCCAADARPVPVLIKGEAPATAKQGDWAWVYGKLRHTELAGKRTFYIEPDRISPAIAPKNPYLY